MAHRAIEGPEASRGSRRGQSVRSSRASGQGDPGDDDSQNPTSTALVPFMPKKRRRAKDHDVLSKADERALLEIEKIKMKRIQQDELQKLEVERKKLRSARKRDRLKEELEKRKL